MHNIQVDIELHIFQKQDPHKVLQYIKLYIP